MPTKKPSTRTRTRPQREITRHGEEVTAFTFRMRQDQLRTLQQIQGDTGIPITQQLRRAIDLWLQTIEAGRVRGVPALAGRPQRSDAPVSLKPKHATRDE